MVNKIWAFFIVVGIIFSIFTNQTEIINQTILNSTKNAFDMILKIFPVMALWLGIMNIAKHSGLLNILARKLSPILSHIFPEIPKNHESMGLITTNIVINLFGLGNAATPFGIKAMKSLQSLNKNKEVASRSMITFLILNTSGLTIVPTTIISLRMMHNSANPTSIVFACFIATMASTLFGIIIDNIIGRRSK